MKVGRVTGVVYFLGGGHLELTYDFAEGMTDVDTPGMRPDNTPYALPFTVGGM